MPDSHQESMKTKMKNYLKRVVARPNTTARKKGGHPRKKKSDYLGEKEKAELTRTFSPPPASTLNRAQRPEALILHQSEEALHYIDYSNSCDIGSAGSSHSSGFNESMFEMVLENTGKHFKQFDVDSPITSEYNYVMREDSDSLKPLSNVFEGIGGVDISDGLEAQKDQSQLVAALTYKNKILTNERNELQHQLEQQEEQYDRMEDELKRVKRERRSLEKSKKEETTRLKGENRELDHSLDSLRIQKLDTENKIELLERERDSVKQQIDELKFQLTQAHEDLIEQRQKQLDLAKSLETKDKQLRTLADNYRVDTDLTTASQQRIDELAGENTELRSHLGRIKIDKQDMAGRITKLMCEISRLRQGVPTSPTSDNGSITSPISNYHALTPLMEEGHEEGESLHDLLSSRRLELSPCKELQEIDRLSDRISESSVTGIIEERNAYQQKAAMLEERIRDMEKLMYVVAPQHYIDDEALQMNAPSRVQYNSGGAGVTEIEYVRTSCLPRSVTTSPDDTDQMRLTPVELEVEHISEEETVRHHHHHHSGTRSRENTDDADSGVLSQSSTDITLDEARGCEECSLWQPEKDLLVEKVLRSELNLQSVRQEKNVIEAELTDLREPRWRGWMVHFLALVLLFLILSAALPFLYSTPCRHNHVSWADLLSLRLVHPRERTYLIPH